MGLYNIMFSIFCVILILLLFLDISKNVLTKYGVGLLIGILVFGIIGYNIWENYQVQEIIQDIDLADSDTEKQLLIQKLMKYFGTQP
jgi:Kef-type K+ transport system membrane component KefB